MSSWNRPGAPGAFHVATQSRVRTQTRYVPADGNVTVVTASATGVPSPWASRTGEPIWPMNCWSTTQPPGSSKPSASTRTWAAEAVAAVHAIHTRSAVVRVCAAVGLLIVASGVCLDAVLPYTIVPLSRRRAGSTVFDFCDFVNALGVAAAIEGGCQPNVDHF